MHASRPIAMTGMRRCTILQLHLIPNIMKFIASILLKTLIVASVFSLAACTPKYDWREVRGENATYVIALPSKPTTFTRTIDLNGTPVSMTMVAAEVEGVTFAVGSAELPDATQAQVSVTAMKTAMVNNIGGKIRQEKVLTMAQSPYAAGKVAVTEVEASGPAANGQSRILFGRFVAKEKRVYQVVVLGAEKGLKRDTVDTFFSSFKFN